MDFFFGFFGFFSGVRWFYKLKRISNLINSRSCSLPNKVYGFEILKKNPWIFGIFLSEQPLEWNVCFFFQRKWPVGGKLLAIRNNGLPLKRSIDCTGLAGHFKRHLDNWTNWAAWMSAGNNGPAELWRPAVWKHAVIDWSPMNDDTRKEDSGLWKFESFYVRDRVGGVVRQSNT